MPIRSSIIVSGTEKPKVKQASTTTGIRMPKQTKIKSISSGKAPESLKDPLKIAQQIKDPNIKDAAITEAQNSLKIKPIVKSEKFTFNKLGQWKIV